ncbi:MAG: sugar ABC transporter permease [Bacillota bacterium]|nr:sugar ABC transporter permease [Bacillota bacterium]
MEVGDLDEIFIRKGEKMISKVFGRIKITKKNAPYIFLLPIISVFLLFLLYPIVDSLIMSFYTFKYGEFDFVGFQNYIMLFKDNVFLTALKNNLIYLVIQVPIMVTLALILANLINQKYIYGKPFFRISIFMPAITALVAYSLVFMLLLNTEHGIINYLLSLINISSIDWLNKPIAARLSIIIAITWRWTGYNMIIMLAGLQGIPEVLYEASDIDGASEFAKFTRITIPLMKNIILFCIITSTIGTLQLFDESYVLTSGGPNNSTITIAHYLYNTGFRYIKFGYAAAISYILVAIIGIISYIQFKIGGE